MANHLLVKTSYLKELADLPKTFKQGDTGADVTRIIEWLRLWQLDENDVDILVTQGQVFTATVEKLVKEIQTFRDLPVTGSVDKSTWEGLTYPLKEAFSTASYNRSTLREKMTYFASRHLQYRSSELDRNNMGPWIRSYMDGNEGSWAYWCQALACTLWDQVFSSVDEFFDEYYANTWACETAREHARARGLLVPHADLLAHKYLPQPGDVVLYLEGTSKTAHHTETVIEVLDAQQGAMRTIGGNTNFAGSRNGVGTFMVDRNFITTDLDLIKMIDQQTIDKHRTFPQDARTLLRCYPDTIIGFDNNRVQYANKRTQIYDDHKKRDVAEMLTDPCIANQFAMPYPKGAAIKQPERFSDPGRITNMDFFKSIYGESKEVVENNLTEIIWCPKLARQKIKVTSVNGVDQKFEAVSAALDQYPELQPYLANIGGTFNWRTVSGTDRLSMHSFGIAMDINVAESNYWQWDEKTKDEEKKIGYVNRIPEQLVNIFEAHGFIWGGRWYHYDTMHFEYRPELL